jgi:hypothetical protein
MWLTVVFGAVGPALGYVAVLAVATVILALFLRPLVPLRPDAVLSRVADIKSFVLTKLNR